jgi:hypothetical protein
VGQGGGEAQDVGQGGAATRGAGGDARGETDKIRIGLFGRDCACLHSATSHFKETYATPLKSKKESRPI